MKRKWWTVCFLSILAGSALHFLYDLWPNPLTVVFAPVNESVWEHLKLLYWPLLAAAFVLTKDEADGRKSWCGLLAGLLGAPLLSSGRVLHAPVRLHAARPAARPYFVRAGNGRRLWAGVAFAEGPPSRMAVRRAGDRGRRLRCSLALFSFAPPELPIFLPPV
ncbi:MAG: DUF6512 family protein [Acutalibacteraceae bacterium]